MVTGEFSGSNTNSDYFVLVSDQILGSPTTAAQWAKRETIAIPATKVMLPAKVRGVSSLANDHRVIRDRVEPSGQSVDKRRPNAGDH